MIKKLRTKPPKLVILELLDTRMNLPKEYKKKYLNLKKGYEGELMFDSLTEKLQNECYILNDLRFNFNDTVFQIDTLIIFQRILQLFEVKNYEGDFFYEKNILYTKSKSEIKDPLLQLNRCQSSFRQFLISLGFSILIEGSVIFINPEFTLYQAPLDAPIILPTQLKRYMKKLNSTPSKLNGMHEKLANKLISLHTEESPYKSLPPYHFHSLKKGLSCAICHSFSITVSGNKCVCGKCGHEEEVETAVLQSVEEIRLLFPDIKITTNIVFEWCKVIDSKKRISRILGKNFKIVGVHKGAFYAPKID